MSKGTKLYSVRIDDKLKAEIDRLLARRRRSSVHAPMTFAEMVRAGLQELVSLDERRRRAAEKAKRSKKGRAETDSDGNERILSDRGSEALGGPSTGLEGPSSQEVA